MLEQVNLEKRKSLKQKIILGLGLVAGLIGLSSFANAGNILYRNEDASIDNLVKSGTTKKLTVGTSTPSNPSTNDIWLDTN